MDGARDEAAALCGALGAAPIYRTMHALDARRLAQLMGNQRDVAVIVDEAGTIMAASPSALAVLGMEPSAHEGRSVLDFCHPDDLDEVLPLLLRARELAGATQAIEVRAVRPDGTVIPVELLPNNLLAEHGVIVLTVRSITKRRQNETRFRTIAESAPIVIFEADLAGQCTFINHHWEALTGQTVQAARGTGWHHVISSASLQQIFDLSAELLAKASPYPGEATAEIKVRHSRFGLRDVIARWSVLRSHDGPTGFVGTVEDITERKLLEARLAHNAGHDPLTGLPNRQQILMRLTQALTAPSLLPIPAAVLFIDLDHFKVVNDSLGHHAGDRLLVAIARRLRSILRPDDVLGRFGGDEFVAVLPGVDSYESVAAIASRMTDAIGLPAAVGASHLLHATASVGIALAQPGSTADSLIRDADAAMYRAKELGRARIESFTDSIRRRVVERLDLAAELREALLSNQLEIHYQPIVDTATCEVQALEALVRWQHPTRGLLHPASFLPLAEEAGLIGELGEFVLTSACRDLLEARLNIDLNVNVSAAQLVRPCFAEQVATSLQATGFPPHRLTLELTESMLMTDLRQSAGMLHKLKALGVGIAVDDFGTGYSSLSYLSRLPVDTLKVDRSFVEGLCQSADDAEIVRAVIRLAQSLELSATAEGVETEEQLSALRELGCEHAQGYLFSPPRPIGEVAALVRREPAAARP